MKFRAERDAFADAVAWTARSLPTRPTVPVLAGLLLEVREHVLTVSGFDYEVSARVALDVEFHSVVPRLCTRPGGCGAGGHGRRPRALIRFVSSATWL